MSNPTSRFDPSATLAEFLTLNNHLVQQKFDKRGGEVAEQDTNVRAGAAWFNLVDDHMLAYFAGGGPQGIVRDTRSAPLVTGSASSGGGTVDFTVVLGRDFGMVQWLRVVSVAGSLGGTIQFFADAARTVEIYSSALQLGEPPVDVDDFYDGTCWSTIAPNGANLEAQTLYGTITNDGASNSTYEVSIVAQG